jgi:hypothetical protein
LNGESRVHDPSGHPLPAQLSGMALGPRREARSLTGSIAEIGGLGIPTLLGHIAKIILDREVLIPYLLGLESRPLERWRVWHAKNIKNHGRLLR